jgi:hypothetical protein
VPSAQQQPQSTAAYGTARNTEHATLRHEQSNPRPGRSEDRTCLFGGLGHLLLGGLARVALRVQLLLRNYNIRQKEEKRW